MNDIARKIFLAEMERNVPRLVKAVKLILYDNGMVHRGTSEAAELDDAFGRIVRAFDAEALPVMAAAERELQAMSDTDLEYLCCGDADDRPLCSAQLDRVLELAFQDEEPIPQARS
jgi:hypothetical protein